MDTWLDRWRRLAPDAELLTPAGRGPFPTVLIFHGCGGLRAHLHDYARAAVAAGWAALLVVTLPGLATAQVQLSEPPPGPVGGWFPAWDRFLVRFVLTRTTSIGRCATCRSGRR